jgi:flagellar motor protein MotB
VDPFKIENAADLIFLSTPAGDAYKDGAHFIQTANIDLGGCEWTPIGNIDEKFFGRYDGQGFIVSGLSVTGSNSDLYGTPIGLFGFTDELRLSNLTVRGTITLPGGQSFWGFVGGVIGRAQESYLQNVRSEVDIETIVGDGIGGLAGYMDFGSIIDNSYFKGDITTQSADMAGGLVGLADEVTITSSYAITNFNTGAVGAGLIGQENCAPDPDTPEVSNSYAIGNGATYGIQAENCGTYDDTFWNSELSANTASKVDPLTGTTSKTTAQLKTFSTYPEAWNIINGWEAYSASAPVKTWGICAGVNDGYPFLLREYTVNPCNAALPRDYSSPMPPPVAGIAGCLDTRPLVKKPRIRPAEDGTSSRLLGKQLGRDVVFAPESSILSPQGKKNLRRIANLAIPTKSCLAVTGFSANAGSTAINQKDLAEQRALVVARYLRKQGVESSIYFHGLSWAKGKDFPGQPRRVEIRILK